MWSPKLQHVRSKYMQMFASTSFISYIERTMKTEWKRSKRSIFKICWKQPDSTVFVTHNSEFTGYWDVSQLWSLECSPQLVSYQVHTLLCSLYLSIKCYIHFSVMINIPQSGIHEWNISPWMFHPMAFIKGCCNLLFKIRFQIGMLHYSNHKVVSLSNHKDYV